VIRFLVWPLGQSLSDNIELYPELPEKATATRRSKKGKIVEYHPSVDEKRREFRA
jgi:hypothetical protein